MDTSLPARDRVMGVASGILVMWFVFDQLWPRRIGKLLSPELRRSAVHHACDHGMSERRACRLGNQPRGKQRYRPTQRDDKDALTQAFIKLTCQYGRYCYRRITALLKQRSWHVGKYL
jgi:hypothetical protein